MKYKVEFSVSTLPNSDQAFIESSKLRDYLLNIEHPAGGSKARYFLSFGFTQEYWEQLHDALLIHAQRGIVAEIREKKHGVLYAIRGVLITPDERNPVVLSVWQIDTGDVKPRFITAYPGD